MMDDTKPKRKVSQPKKRCMSPLVNPCLNHPNGAYGRHKLYDVAICEHVPDLYKGGKSDAYVAYHIGISKQTLYLWYKQYPEFKAAVDHGRTLAEMWWQEISETGVVGELEIQPTIWAIQMRNRYDYDKNNEAPPSPDEQLDNPMSAVKELAEKKLNDNSQPY